LAALGSLVALAHPLTILASLIGAPFTVVNPTIGIGMITGMLEAILRKPRVQDFENLNTDIISIKGFYRNRLTRILLVFFFSNLGGSIGTFIALPYLTSLLA
jgi:pheromone shutdown protein TraB